MTAIPSAGGELRMTTAAGPAPVSDALHGPSLLTASALRNRPNNGADVLPVRLAGRSLTDGPTSVAVPSTGRESQRQQGEPGRHVAHVVSATTSHKTNAADPARSAAFTPTGSESTREAMA